MLNGANTYTGAINVDGGTLQGNGSVAGDLIVGDGATGASFGAGNSIGEFGVAGTLTLNSDATFVFEWDSSALTADQVTAADVTITDATFSFSDLGAGAFAATGNDFTLTSAIPEP